MQPVSRVRRHGKREPCHLDSDSVICYGTARVVENSEERRAVLDEFNHSFRPNAETISLESAMRTAAVEITIKEMTGRQERDRETVYWRYVFQH